MNLSITHSDILRVAAAFLAAATLTGCSHKQDEPASGAGDIPVLIAANTAESRVATPLAGNTDFGAWAWKVNADDSKSLVIGRKPTAEQYSEYYTRIADGAWSYEYTDGTITQYLRYWDRAAKSYYFTAYSPYMAGDDPVNLTHDILATPLSLSISEVKGNVSTAAGGIDWLEARWERQILPTLVDIDLIPNKEYLTANLGDVVPLVFHHIMANVEFRIFSGAGEAVILDNISISLSSDIYTQADYDTGAWSNTSSPETNLLNITTPLDISGTTKEKYHSLVSLLQLPQDVAGRTFTVNAETSDHASHTGTFPITEGWAREKKYIYYLTISGKEILLMGFSADKWIYEDDIVVSDPIINW